MTESSFLQVLDWDSAKLGIKVARIMSDELSKVAFETCLQTAKKENIKLLYWAIPSKNERSIELARTLGILVDHKITYLMQLNSSLVSPSNVEIYPPATPNQTLIELAYESGKYSRFKNDPNLTESQFKTIYREWITNSTKRLIADEVFVIYQNNEIAGMITVGKKNNRGDIGLLAVSEKTRGQQIGSRLVQAAQNYFIDKGYSESQVVTQQENIPACRLYEKCGYHIEKVEYFFHFWI